METIVQSKQQTVDPSLPEHHPHLTYPLRGLHIHCGHVDVPFPRCHSLQNASNTKHYLEHNTNISAPFTCTQKHSLSLQLIQPLKHTNCKAQTTSILVIITWCYIDVWRKKSAYSYHFRNSVIGEESTCNFKHCSSTIVVTLNCDYAILSW